MFLIVGTWVGLIRKGLEGVVVVVEMVAPGCGIKEEEAML